jgi:kynurenine formamidase
MTNAAEKLAERIRAGHAKSLADGLAAPADFVADQVELLRGVPDDGMHSGAELAARWRTEGETLSAQMPDLAISDVTVETKGDDVVILEGKMQWTSPDDGPMVNAFHIEYTMQSSLIVRAVVTPQRRAPMNPDDVLGLHKALSNWGRGGPSDQLGALNFITPEVTASAAATVRSGRSVSCARPLATQPAADNPTPVAHHMTGTATEGHGGDYFAISTHGFATTHIDALCHIFHQGKLFNGYSAQTVTAHGAMELGIHHLRSGIVTRGVLLDIPAARGVEALAPGEPIFPEDLDKAASEANVEVQSGDALLVRTGRWRWRELHGPWDPIQRAAGLDASCLTWLHEREVAVLGCDGLSDVMPSRVAPTVQPNDHSEGGIDLELVGLFMPIHTVAIVAMGVHLIDNLDLDELADACAAEGRWDFLFVVSPLVLERGTASPVNPIAVL